MGFGLTKLGQRSDAVHEDPVQYTVRIDTDTDTDADGNRKREDRQPFASGVG
jgi:hypothetical protein